MRSTKPPRKVSRNLLVLALPLCALAGCAGDDDAEVAGDALPAMRADAGRADAGDAEVSNIDRDAGAPDDGSATMRDDDAPDASMASDAATMTNPDPPPPTMMCLPVTQACDQATQCCDGLSCDMTTLGRVCCGEAGAPCATANGEDCCRDLWCIEGHCGYPKSDPPDTSCNAPCKPPPGLLIERDRLMAIGGSFLGICGDANHTYGYHVAAANLPADDYSLEGAANAPVCQWHAAAIDIGMNWPVSRDWLRWLIGEIRSDAIKGIAEVIGSYDGQNVRYWSDSSGWSTDGIAYTGQGHDTWTHVAVYRSTTLQDHGLLAGWTATSGP